eukprot:m.189605 g.189605  ORF g.189605 m.189605 type:complete len:138 (+) comp10036_c0_seq3:1833-2246(+)
MFPPNGNNLGGDIYLLMPTDDATWILAEIQCKDYFGSFDPATHTARLATMVQDWQDGNRWLNGSEVEISGARMSNPIPEFLRANNIQVVRLLCTSTPLESALPTLGPNEALLDLRRVVPTAAYNLEGLHHIRDLLSM